MNPQFRPFIRHYFSSFGRLDGDSAESWEVGDVAECISPGIWYQDGHGPADRNGPQTGDRARVTKVRVVQIPLIGRRTFLYFAAYPGIGFIASCFRKVRPSADEATAADADFIDLLQSQPRQLPPVPAREFEEAAARWAA